MGLRSGACRKVKKAIATVIVADGRGAAAIVGGGGLKGWAGAKARG